MKSEESSMTKVHVYSFTCKLDEERERKRETRVSECGINEI